MNERALTEAGHLTRGLEHALLPHQIAARRCSRPADHAGSRYAYVDVHENGVITLQTWYVQDCHTIKGLWLARGARRARALYSMSAARERQGLDPALRVFTENMGDQSHQIS